LTLHILYYIFYINSLVTVQTVYAATRQLPRFVNILIY